MSTISQQRQFESVYSKQLQQAAQSIRSPARRDVVATFQHPFAEGKVVAGAELGRFATIEEAKAVGRARPGMEVVLARPRGGFSLRAATTERFLASSKLRSGLSGVVFRKFAPETRAVLSHEAGATTQEFSRDSLERLNVIRGLNRKNNHREAIRANRVLADFDKAAALVGYYEIVTDMAFMRPYQAEEVLEEYRALLGRDADRPSWTRFSQARAEVDREIRSRESR